MLIILNNLSPIINQYNNTLYRTPLRKINDQYTVYVSENYHRIYNVSTLPDEIKTKMAMILSNDWNIVEDDDLTTLNLFTTTNKNEYRDIGWRASETMFIVMLDYLTLKQMKGGNK